MCRGIDHNGRRCPSDTSEARMLRRRNVALRIKYAGQTTPPVEIKLPAYVKPQEHTVESIRADIESLNTLAFRMKEAGESHENILLAYDETLNKVGAGVEHLATEKYGAPTDEDLQNVEIESKENARLEVSKRRKELREDDERLTEELKALRDKLHEFADPITHPILTERWNVWEEKAPELYQAWKDKDEELSASQKEFFSSFSHIKTAVQEALKEKLEKRNEAMQAALRDVGVKFADPETFMYSEDSHSDAIKSLKLALQYFPQGWVNRSNISHEHTLPLRIKRTDGRAHYHSKAEQTQENSIHSTYKAELLVSKDSVVHVGDNDGMRASLHEFSHRVEHVAPHVAAYEEAFLKRRTGFIAANGVKKPESLVSLNGVPLDEGDKPDDGKPKKEKKKPEVGYRDNFVHQYMGKVYAGTGYKEILSMGMESLFAGTHGALSGLHNNKPDPDYKRFILGVLASSAAKYAAQK